MIACLKSEIYSTFLAVNGSLACVCSLLSSVNPCGKSSYALIYLVGGARERDRSSSPEER